MHEILMKISEANMKQKYAKDRDADEKRGEWYRRNGTAFLASGKDMLYRVRLCQKSCDIAGSKVFPTVWKVRKCAEWVDKSKIGVIRTWVAEGHALEVTLLHILP